MRIEYVCQSCGITAPKGHDSMICPLCDGELKGKGPRITGTRDSFGVGREFVDEKTHQTIDNWKKWERAGYRNPLETCTKPHIKEQVKDKIKSLRGVAQRQLSPADMPL